LGYWRRRLEGREYDVIQFRNGCATRAPEMVVEFRGLRRYGRGRAGYYAIAQCVWVAVVFRPCRAWGAFWTRYPGLQPGH